LPKESKRIFRGTSFPRKKGRFLFTVSIGLFSFQDLKRIDRETFIEKEDQALLQAKQSGKNIIFAEQNE